MWGMQWWCQISPWPISQGHTLFYIKCLDASYLSQLEISNVLNIYRKPFVRNSMVMPNLTLAHFSRSHATLFYIKCLVAPYLSQLDISNVLKINRKPYVKMAMEMSIWHWPISQGHMQPSNTYNVFRRRHPFQLCAVQFYLVSLDITFQDIFDLGFVLKVTVII